MSRNSDKRETFVVAVDPGSRQSGVVVLVNGQIKAAEIASNAKIPIMIRKMKKVGRKLRVLIEDMRPYSTKLSQHTIDTLKWMGELVYRLESSRIAYREVPRSTIKAWVYQRYAEIVIPLVQEKIKVRSEEKPSLKLADGSLRSPSHIWVDDKIIIAAMRQQWGIPQGKRFEGNKHGIKSHTWQALAVGTWWLQQKGDLPERGVGWSEQYIKLFGSGLLWPRVLLPCTPSNVSPFF